MIKGTSFIKNLVHHNGFKHIDIFHHYVRKLTSTRQVIFENIIILMIWVLIFDNLGVFGPKHYEYMERLSIRQLMIWYQVEVLEGMVTNPTSNLCPYLHFFECFCSLVIKAFLSFVVLTHLLVEVSYCFIVFVPLLVNTSSSFITHWH